MPNAAVGALAHFVVVAAILTLSNGCTIARTISSTGHCKQKPVRLEKWSENAAEEEKTIRVLLVHGMNNHPFGLAGSNPYLDDCNTYRALQKKLSEPLRGEDIQRLRSRAVGAQFSYFIQRLASELHAGKENDPPANDFILTRAADGHTAIGFRFTRSFGKRASGEPALKFYIVNWGLAAAVFKEDQFGNWWSSTRWLWNRHTPWLFNYRDLDPALDKNRAPVNKALKRNTIDWGLGDAALYLSPEGDKFRTVVKEGAEQLKAETKQRDRLVIVSASLGSTIALDTAPQLFGAGPTKDLLTKPDKFAEDPEQSRTVFYMFANQYALLSLGRPGQMAHPWMRLNDLLKRSKIVLQIYSFTDPNDLLSLPLEFRMEHVAVCNMFVRNPGLTIGVAMHPGHAHVNYERNKHVINVLVHGG